MPGIYSGGHAGRGGIYSGGRAGRGAAKKKPGHGFGHILGQTLTDLKDVAVNLPGGLYHSGGTLIHHPGRFAVQTAKATYGDFRHPLRHPGYTLLDILGVAGGGIGAGTRLATLGRAATLGEAGRLLLRGAEPGRRMVAYQGATHDIGGYSRAASTRLAQKATDRFRAAHPEARLPVRSLPEKIGAQRDRRARTTAALTAKPAAELVAAAKGLKKAQLLALRVVAEKVPLAERISYAERELANMTGNRRPLANHLKILRRTAEYVYDVKNHEGHVVPRLRPDQNQLVDVYQKARGLAGMREADQIAAGHLTEHGAKKRAGAIRELLGANTELLPELFGQDEPFYISYRDRKNPKAIYRPAQIGGRESIGIPRKDPTLTHALTGEALRTGRVNPDTPKVVAESFLASNRMLELFRQRHELQALAHDKPTSRYDIPIRPIWMKHGWPNDVRDLIDQVDRGADETTLRDKLNAVHAKVFPKDLTDEEIRTGKVKFIDSRLLGKRNRPGPLAGIGQNPGAARALATVDAANNAAKALLVQLKPAYAAPNIGGNLFLNLIQQGPAVLPNLARSVRLSRSLGREQAAAIDTLMGEGIARSILGNPGLLHQIPETLARFWQPFVDTPFRRASFLHEARRAGFKSNADLRRLLEEKTLQPKLLDVTERANSAIIDYARLGPVEQDIVRRVIFLYPWVKGATVYGGHFLGEHPVQAWLDTQIAARQKLERDATLGPVPSWAEALFKVGGTKAKPLVVNPAAIAIFQTPATELTAARSFLGGGGGSAYDLANQLAPVPSAVLAALAHKDSFSGHNFPRSTSSASILGHNLYQGLPQKVLIDRLLHPNQAGHTFPMSRREALLQFLAGTASPRVASRGRLNLKAAQEGR